MRISETAPGRIFFARKGSPLQLGFAEDGCHFASSDAPLVGVCSQTLYLDDGHWGVATAEGLTLFAAGGSPAVLAPKPLPASSLAARKEGRKEPAATCSNAWRGYRRGWRLPASSATASRCWTRTVCSW